MARLQQSEERVRKMACHDPLTELPNRQLFEELLVRKIARSKRTETDLGAVKIALDTGHISLSNRAPVH